MEEIKFAQWILKHCKVWSNEVSFRDETFDYDSDEEMENLYELYEKHISGLI